MCNKPKFSIIDIIEDEDYLTESIESILNQSLDFKENIQLIILDNIHSNNSNNIILEYKKSYPDNIEILNYDNFNSFSGILDKIESRYVNFLNNGILSKDTLSEVYNFFENNYDNIDVVSIPIINWEDGSENPLNYKYNTSRVIDLEVEPNNPEVYPSSAFIKKDMLHDFNLKNDFSLVSMINEILIHHKKLGVISSVNYYTTQRFNKDEFIEKISYDKEYFTYRLKNFHKNLINYCMNKESTVPSFIQYMFAYDLQWMLQVPELNVFSSKDEVNEFWYCLRDITGYIGDNAIMNNKNIYKPLRSFFMYIRKREYNIEIIDDEVLLKAKNYIIDKLNRHKIWIDIIEIDNGYLNISGLFLTNFYNNSININLIQNNNDNIKKYNCKYVNYPQKDRSTLRFLSIDWRFDYNFNIKVPLDNIHNSRFTFEIRYNENNKEVIYNPDIDFRLPAGLSKISSYFIKDSMIVYYKNKSLYVKAYSTLMMIFLEIKNLIKILFSFKNGFISAIILRIVYLILYPYMKNQKIWLFNDRLTFADDNAKHLYEYASKIDDDIRKFYVIGHDSDDYKIMRKYDNNIIAFKSFKHKILYLYAQKHITAFVNEDYRNPFYVPNKYDRRSLYSGLITSKRYFLQHGITLGNVSESLKKYNINLSLIVTSSDYEKQSFFDYNYNYDDNVIQTLGLPRYDNLTTDNSKKQIVFMPTWRSSLNSSKKTFIKSNFYKILDSFINNTKLHEYLKNNGYKFVFKPHPELMKYIDLFNYNDNVYVSTNESYQDLFRDSSILITDYSSVAFDFAYLKKPVIYYQPNDDYHYEKGYFDFKTCGFGDVIVKEEELIEKIKTYLDNRAIMEDKYKERVNKFFKYNDKNNSKRVYEWIVNN